MRDAKSACRVFLIAHTHQTAMILKSVVSSDLQSMGVVEEPRWVEVSGTVDRLRGHRFLDTDMLAFGYDARNLKDLAITLSMMDRGPSQPWRKDYR